MFRQKLKNNVKNKLMRYEKIVNKFDDLIKTTIELNDKLYEQIMNKKYSNQQSRKIENYIDQKNL